MTAEQILLLVLFLLLPLVNVFLQWLRRQRAVAEGRNEDVKRRLSEQEQIRQAQSFRQPRKTDIATRSRGLQEPTIPVRPRRPLLGRVRGLQDARRGIVLLTILGPCRALEPPGEPARAPLPPNSVLASEPPHSKENIRK